MRQPFVAAFFRPVIEGLIVNYARKQACKLGRMPLNPGQIARCCTVPRSTATEAAEICPEWMP